MWHDFFSHAPYICKREKREMERPSNTNKGYLFFKKMSENVSSDEEKQIQELLSDSEENRHELDLVKQIIAIEDEIKGQASYHLVEGYAGMKRKVEKKTRKVFHWSTFLYKVAAVLVFPLLISTLTLLYKDKQKRDDVVAWMEVEAAPGVISRLELPDHSKVWLNSGSKLRYPAVFTGGKREVELDGEGYFEVKSDKTNPFYVGTASGQKVMAYGTSFNVNAYEELEMMDAVLVTGKIDFILAGNTLSQLQPGEQAVFDKKRKTLDVRSVSAYEKIAWKDGKTVFRNASLDEVFRQLERRYNVEIVVHDDMRISGEYKCRVTFTNETIQQIFSYLEEAAPIKWKLSTPLLNNDTTLTKQRIDVWIKKDSYLIK